MNQHFANKKRKISEENVALCRAALMAANNAYAPYSGFAVGAAVRTKDGNVFVGANLENASYGLGICAEIAALSAANTAGKYLIKSIAVTGLVFWPDTNAETVVTPCGRCRQKIKEAADVSGTDITVLCCNGDLNNIREYRISELLPDSFGPETMGLIDVWPKMQSRLRSIIGSKQAAE